MFKIILKISFLLVFAGVYAEPDGIDATGDEAAAVVIADELDTIAVDELDIDDTESVLTEIIDDAVLAEVISEDSEDLVAEDDATVLIKDVMLVLDNSGSMKKNDPDFLVSKAVKEFISSQDINTRIGIVIFDQDVRMPVTLTDASYANRASILDSLENINYSGQFTDSPAGIERAIYELKNNGRDDARKVIIFMTDGIVDTGAAESDMEKSKWLREDLAPDAADNEIKIFGIAFTEQADFQLIQSIAQNAEGEYYRALTAADLQGVFEKVNGIINKPPEPEPLVEEISEPKEVVIQAPPPVVQPAPAPVIIEVPAQTMGEEERIRSIIMMAAAIILTITLLGILILLLRRNRELKAGQNQFVQDAYINDLQGKTDQQTHKLGEKPVMFGRVAGKDTEYLDYIVVNESTIGRRHALIEFKDYSFWIIDQGSINGTFVNGEAVSSEVRLKHGDRIRLHKCEFEFIMPEMEDSGMTVISNTVFAAQAAADDAEEATQLREHGDQSGENSITDVPDVSGSDDMDFDITGAAADELSDLYEPDDEEETLIRGDVADSKNADAEPDFMLTEEGLETDSEDETIMLDDNDVVDDEDATLRKTDI